MNMIPLAKIIRVKNCHLQELADARSLNNVERYLEDRGFIVSEESEDGFYVSYTNEEYTNENRNTLLRFDDQGNLLDLQFGLIAPEA